MKKRLKRGPRLPKGAIVVVRNGARVVGFDSKNKPATHWEKVTGWAAWDLEVHG